MSNNSYVVYVNKCIALASTIVIKSQDTVDGMNKYLIDYYGDGVVDTLLPKTWRYYLNISGEYHPFDTEMKVVSLDTLETIVFNKENLALHRATAKGYAYGTRNYQELLNQYPDQELLIMGILYPVDIDKAIESADGTILGYPPDLVEPNEYSLINKLQNWINGYKIRWTNQQFGISDPLYPATSLGIMYLNLVPAILNFRLEACKTNEAHSFHIAQYLASHGFLDSYINSLTLKQTLFFYRNIAYIEKNAGKQYIFEWLIDHIMTERFLPIVEYTMRHDISDQPANHYPELVFSKKQLNTGYSADLANNITLREVLDKEDPEARMNPKYKADMMPYIEEQMKNSLSNVLRTKLLESSVIDNSDSLPYTLEDILINHWLYLSTSNIYLAFVVVTNPKTGEKLPLSTKEAYALYWYAYCKSVGIELENIPKVFAARVQRSPLPSADDLMSVIDNRYIASSIADQVLSYHTEFKEIISVEAFYNKCLSIYHAVINEYNLIASQEHYYKCGMVYGLVSRMYSDNVCDMSDSKVTYHEWFSAKSIDISDLTNDDLKLLTLDIVRQATGIDSSNVSSLRNVQKAMVNLLKQLSSYSIQIVSNINEYSLKQTNQTVIRVGDIGEAYRAHIYNEYIGSNVMRIGSKQNTLAVMSLVPCKLNDITDIRLLASIKLNIGTVQTLTVREQTYIRLDCADIHAKPLAPLVSNPEKIIPAIGIDQYLALNPVQKQDFKDIYNKGYVPVASNTSSDALNTAGGYYVSENYLVNVKDYVSNT